ncbi:glycine--tRNA ligase subunit beta [Paracandidimonas soli]|uniref:Glycine--tRNA ligase beta subunit n=1 Tax=Paracandidimonas soli TaxID=1917182 RepID=A0A4R3VHH5_9BURK|nr:glycine--tRNA ligase subunit beta [Paracandidimonas soli]TCV03169.1 glycyl-tRNA synthetase beta chain [Paracandidimonas soli]
MSASIAIAEQRPLLIELLTEELPPKALAALGAAFAASIEKSLRENALLADDSATTSFATPRRLAVRLDKVLSQAPERPFTEKLMPAKIGLTESGEITPALAKKLQAKNLGHLTAAELIRESDGKQDVLFATGVAPGAILAETLQAAIDQAIDSLPIPKVMRYQLADGKTSVRFVRPAHGLVVLWGGDVLPAQALGLQSGNVTQGHRFLGAADIVIRDALSYESQLREDGKVIASYQKRRQAILDQLNAQADALDASLGEGDEVDALLDEVTSLVELPAVYVGQFDPQFLAVPPECLILTMRLNQKYFPLFEPEGGKLTHRFLIVSNMRIDDPSNIIEGNERVVRPRLADAQFFYETDRKEPLAGRVDTLANRVYHNKLGSQRERVERVRDLAVHIAGLLGANTAHADRAALLAKADLNSNMVGEFPELQGVIGAYYAAADGEPDDVVLAIRNQYQTRVDAPVTNASLTSAVLFMAERLETLAGIWGIGLAPTGERDPYGLRRAALGLISAYEQLHAGGFLKISANALDLDALLAYAVCLFPAGTLSADTAAQVRDFILERYRNQLAAQHERSVVDAVLAVNPPLHQVQSRIQACAEFAGLPQAASLSAANKRIGNLLKKAEGSQTGVDAALLVAPAEQALQAAIEAVAPQAQAQFEAGDFTASLATLAQTSGAVDTFFNDVMVMDDDPAIRANRLALLGRLHQLMNQVADIARLAQ